MEPLAVWRRPIGVRISFVGVIGIAVVVMGVAACGNGATNNSLAQTSPSPHPSMPVLSTESSACPKQDAVHMPADTSGLYDGYICEQAARQVPGDGMWMFEDVKHVTDGLDQLISTYSMPDQTASPGSNFACSTVTYRGGIVWLHGTQTVAVRSPTDACGAPLPPAANAYAALITTIVSSQKLRQVQTQQSANTGCSDQYKDVLIYNGLAGDPSKTEGGPQPIPDAGSFKACFYKTSQDAQGDPIGQLYGSKTLTSAERSAFNSALVAAFPDPTCKLADHTTFAVVTPSTPQGPTYLALDGCAVQQNEGVWRGSDALRAILNGS